MRLIDDSVSCRMANMGGICAILVVSQHIGGYVPVESIWWYLLEGIRTGFARVAVPFFFLASGFFLAGHFDERGYWKAEVAKRVRTLLVPMSIWCVCGMFWVALWTAIANYIAGRHFGFGIPFCNGDFLPKLGVLWYIRTLFLFVLVSPFFCWFVRKFLIRGVVVLFLIYWIVHSMLLPHSSKTIQDLFYYLISFEGIAYFSLGIFLRLKDDAKVMGRQRFWPCGLFAGLASCCLVALHLLVVKDIGGFYDLRHFHYLFTMYAIWSIMPTRRWPQWLIGSVFAIYLLHTNVAVIGQIVVKRLPIDGTILGFFVRWVIAVAGAIGVANEIKKYCPRMAKVVFGGR